MHAVSYAYEDNRNLMTTVDNRATDLSGSSLSAYGYTYDTLGRRDDRTQSGSAINTPSTDDFSYNSRSDEARKRGDGVSMTRPKGSLKRVPSGRFKEQVIGSTNDVETAAAWNPTFDYDKIGNRLWSVGVSPAAYTTNELNQYTAVDSASPVHDLDGNLLDDGGNWTYTWNNENRLSSATNGTVTIDFTYDHQGRLVKKDDGTDIEVYVYDRWNRIASFDASNFTLQTSNLWGLDLSRTQQGVGGVGGLLKEGNLYPTYDANGNIMQKLDGTGSVLMSVDYDPFGNIIEGTLTGEYGFSTKPLINDLNWYYYGFRYYDPVTGRWPSRDPIEERGGLNLYAMVRNGVVSSVDILGLTELDCGCDGDGNNIDPVDDDFGRSCCPDDMQTVRRRSRGMNPFELETGHSSIGTPNCRPGSGTGFVPNGNPIANRPGNTEGDSREQDSVQNLDACPASVSAVESEMEEHQNDPYNVTGLFGGSNCHTWASNVLNDAGYQTPPQMPGAGAPHMNF